MSLQREDAGDLARLEEQIRQLRDVAAQHGLDVEDEVRLLEDKAARLREESYRNLTAVERQSGRYDLRLRLEDAQGAILDAMELASLGAVPIRRRGDQVFDEFVRTLAATQQKPRDGELLFWKGQALKRAHAVMQQRE